MKNKLLYFVLLISVLTNIAGIKDIQRINVIEDKLKSSELTGCIFARKVNSKNTYVYECFVNVVGR